MDALRSLSTSSLWTTVRRLARQPAFAVGVVLLLAIGTGLSVAAFTLLDRLLWRPIPAVASIDRLVAIYTREGGHALGVSSYADLRVLASRTSALSAVAAYKPLTMELDGDDLDGGAAGDVVSGMLVSTDYFRALGLGPALGRFFTSDEQAEPGVPVVVLGHSLWQTRFGGRSDILGRRVDLDGLRCTVVGVTPPGFAGTSEDQRAALFVPISLQPVFMGENLLAEHGWGGVLGIARLAPGASVRAADAEVRRVAAELAAELPTTNRDRTMSVEPLRASHLSALGRSLWRGASALVAATVVLVLLVACANVATLLAARAVSRREELGLRRTLGATPGRLARELALETLVLAVAGGLVGLLVAQLALALVGRAPLPALQGVTLDGRALAVALGLTVLSTLAAGIAPVRENRRQLEAATRASNTPRSRGRAAWVVLQLTVSLLLLVGTTLFARTLANLLTVSLGFDSRGLLVASFGARAGDSAAERVARWRAVGEALRAVEGVRAAALTSRLPGGGDDDQLGVHVAGSERTESLAVQAVGGDYFRALGVAPIEGRGLELADERRALPVAVVNKSLADRHWPGGSALGGTIEVIGAGPVTVVGVVPDIRDGELRERPAPLFYVPWTLAADHPPRELHLLARTVGDPRALVPRVRAAAMAAGAGRARAVGSFEELLSLATARERGAVALLGSLSGLSLLLTALGLYSLLSWSVAQRAREIGVRAALGADRTRLRLLVLGEALRLAAIGCLLGTLGGLAAARTAQRALFGVAPYDPWNVVLPALALLLVAAAAAWLPARRATRIDPMAAIRA